MSDITKHEPDPVSAATLEHVLGTGDLSKLSTQGRVEYYTATCRSLGLNPLTRPMRFLSLNGQIQLYFTRDGTDQLRKAQGITLHVVDKLIEAGLFTVTVRARTKDGREDEDIGAVVLPQSGESRANALMKAMTKAKRRVTLSICGLGQTDESELDTMPGARVFDAEDELPVAPIRDARTAINNEVPLRAAAAPMPRAPRVAEKTPWTTPQASWLSPLEETDPHRWELALDTVLANCQSRAEVEQVGAHHSVGTAIVKAPNGVRERVSKKLATAYGRFADDAEAEAELPEIVGEDRVGAG